MTDRENGLREQGRKLAAWRAAKIGEDGKRLTQVEAARMVGATQTSWSCWEKGRKAPDAFFAERLETLTKGKLQVSAKGWVFRRGIAPAAPSSSALDVAKSA